MHTPEGAAEAVPQPAWTRCRWTRPWRTRRPTTRCGPTTSGCWTLGGFGVPTLVLDGTAVLFGPVVTPAPTGRAAGRLWDLVAGWAEFPHLYELRRPKTAPTGTTSAPVRALPRGPGLEHRRPPGRLDGPASGADSSAAGLTAQLDEVWILAGVPRRRPRRRGVGPPPPARAGPCGPVRPRRRHRVDAARPAHPKSTRASPEHVRNDIGGFNEGGCRAGGRARQPFCHRFVEVTAARRSALVAMTEEDFPRPPGPRSGRPLPAVHADPGVRLWVHEQDIRDAVGRPGQEDGTRCRAGRGRDPRALGYVVGKKAGVPDGSSVTFELTGPVVRTLHVAVDGRAQVVDRLDSPATAMVTLGSGVFTRLACGRVQPDAVLGAVRLAGGDRSAPGPPGREPSGVHHLRGQPGRFTGRPRSLAV